MELKIQNLCMNYGEKAALDGVSFSLPPGVYGLLGPNGAGKSTLMNIIVGNLQATGGEVMIDNRNVFEMGQEYRQMLGYMPQQQTLYPSFSAVRFLSYMAALKGMSKERAKKRIPEVLKQVSLLESADRKIKTFSGGMKQRLLIAQAVLDEPQILILDEPTAGLDPKQRIVIRNLIAQLALDKIVLIATHVVSDVEFISKELILLQEGKILKKDTRKHLTEELKGKVFELEIASGQLPEISAQYKIGNIVGESEKLFVRIIGTPDTERYFCRPVRPNLEDVYLYYFGE